MWWHKKPCKGCESMKEEIAYLRSVMNSLFAKFDVPPAEPVSMVENFMDEPEPKLNPDGFEPAEVYDD